MINNDRVIINDDLSKVVRDIGQVEETMRLRTTGTLIWVETAQIQEVRWQK